MVTQTLVCILESSISSSSTSVTTISATADVGGATILIGGDPSPSSLMNLFVGNTNGFWSLLDGACVEAAAVVLSCVWCSSVMVERGGRSRM